MHLLLKHIGGVAESTLRRDMYRDDKHKKHDCDRRDMPNIDKQNGNRREPGERSFYNEVRFFKWSKDDIAVSLRARSASYGGGV